MAAFNSTLGFHRVYATYNREKESLEAVARLLDIDIRFIKTASIEHNASLQRQRGFMANSSDAAEIDTHRRIYADMVADDIQSALILSSKVDVEVDLKMRLATAMSSNPEMQQGGFDFLLVGQKYSNPLELGASHVRTVLQQQRGVVGVVDSSLVQQRFWTKKEFLERRTRVYRPSSPRGFGHAYAVSGQMARHLYYASLEGHGAAASGARDLDDVLADAIGAAGLPLVFSVSPPPVVLHCSEEMGGQYLARSALHAMSLRTNDPARYAPYVDWVHMWK
ncbi:hypothetical protein GGI21_004327 [Coemansia aciculifera]|uniref:Uncharacterized protein n=1 Tax=Coemansia aciculifera TaxID=417176 RepID=A0ACC1M081_9FUNG|nr:hypothetical protein IWW38_003985 [Coemansia aciculifera]KAJ2904190.1 hypothetical protein GGI21_004327 [Coemansia aciculifera]